MFKQLLIVFLVSLPYTLAIDCRTCKAATYEDECRRKINCGPNIKSCLKETFYLDGKFVYNKGCHDVEFEEGNSCIPSYFSEGPNTGEFIRCVCTGNDCNGGSTIGMGVLSSMAFAAASLGLKSLML